jgi:mediator of RNA polymerase II transcription subunit 14
MAADCLFFSEFPRVPTGILARHIAEEADARLSRHLPPHEEPGSNSGAELLLRTPLPEGVIDTPLIRVFNFFRVFSNFFGFCCI